MRWQDIKSDNDRLTYFWEREQEAVMMGWWDEAEKYYQLQVPSDRKPLPRKYHKRVDGNKQKN